MKKKQICITLPVDLVDFIDGTAATASMSRSECIALVLTAAARGDRATLRAPRDERLDEVLSVAYSCQAQLAWYLTQIFNENQSRAEMLQTMSLCDESDFFLEVGRSMSDNGGNLGRALADSAASTTDFRLDFQHNDFADRADFVSYYRNAGSSIEQARAKRRAAKERNAAHN